MEYNLSQKNDNQKKQYESIIEQNDKKWLKLAEEIKNIRAGKEGRTKDGQFAILELQIQQEEIERDTDTKKEAIADLYVREMKENLIQRERNKEISASEFANEIRKIREYKSMISTKNSIKDYDKEEIILEMKLRLEHMKKSMGKVPKEQADKKIAEIKQTLSDNEEYRQDEVNDLAKQNFEYKRKNLYYQRNSGKISKDELKQKLEELEQIKGKIPTDKEFKEMLTDLSEKHLEQPQQSQEYEREVSKRDEFHRSYFLEQLNNQDINKWHEKWIYISTQDFDNRIFKYGRHAPGDTETQYDEYLGERLGEEYARGANGEKAELAKQFAMLEVQGRYGDFVDIYNSEETSGYDNPKLLLQLEKVNGLNIEELEDIIGLDTSSLHQDIFVATYEIEEYDYALKKNVMKPIKEYYQRDKNGDFDIIGTGTENKTTFVIDGMSFNVDTDQVLQGDSLEKITQREMSDRLIKNGIEDSLKSGKVTEVAKLTDDIFLNDFREQCGIPETWDLGNRTFIVSTINEKGEEDFDILIRYDNAGDTEYEHLMGINATDKSGREMYTTPGRQIYVTADGQISGGAKKLVKTQTLKEFMTKSGHRYAITRNAEGKLGFNEIFRENENIIQGEHIDAYTHSTDDLVNAYEKAEIDQEDMNKAYERLNRTKAEREQSHNQTETDKFRDR